MIQSIIECLSTINPRRLSIEWSVSEFENIGPSAKDFILQQEIISDLATNAIFNDDRFEGNLISPKQHFQQTQFEYDGIVDHEKANRKYFAPQNRTDEHL